MNKKVAFIGVTGMLGKPVAKTLHDAGFLITALVRDIESARKEVSPAIHLIPGDLKNEGDLKRLFVGKDVLYLNLSIKQTEKPGDWHTELEGIRLLLPLAKAAGIKRIVYLSSLIQNYQGTDGFNWWVFDVKLEAVKMIREFGLPYTIFYPSTFMETIITQYKMGRLLLLSGESKYKQHFIAVQDYARQVVKSLKVLNNESKEYVVQGPEAFNSDEAIAEFKKNYSRGRLFIVKASPELIKFYGSFSQKMEYGYHVIQALNNYPEKFEADNTWKELGKPTITLKEFASKI